MWVLVCIVIVSIFFWAGSIMKNRLVKVPNIVGKTYNDACITLSRFGLNYDLIVNGKDMYVYEQGVEPGTIVNRGTKIILYTKRISSSENVIDTYANNKELCSLTITFVEANIILGDIYNDLNVDSYGKVIDDFVISEVRLVTKNSTVSYEDGYYIVEDGKLIFKNIVGNEDYLLNIILDGYNEINIPVRVSAKNVNDNNIICGMTKTDSMTKTQVCFMLADLNNSTNMDVVYLADVRLDIQWSENEEYISYITGSNGQEDKEIWISQEQKINVKIVDPYKKGNDFICSIILYPMVINECVKYDIIFVGRDNECSVVNNIDFYNLY